MILFWDLRNESPEIMDEDGIMWSYGEDSVAVEHDPNTGRYWMKICKTCDITPFNTPDRFEVFDEIQMIWCELSETDFEFYKKIKRMSGCPEGCGY